MNQPLRLRYGFFLALLIAAFAQASAAQEPAAIRKIVLPSLDSQVRARLIALDRRLILVHSPSLAAALIGQIPSPFSALPAFTPILADPRNAELWEQLPEEYYRLMSESGEALITQTEAPANGVAWSSTQTRRLCQQRLASLSRASLDWYRQRVDSEAKALLTQGRQTRSPLQLRRIVDELFCSSVGDQALDLLGNLSFEQGHFSDAWHWWSLLIPEAGARGAGLRFPGPKIGEAQTLAKQILALIFQGRLDEAQQQITHLQQKYPHAKGPLAGQDEGYGKTLHKTLADFAQQRQRNNDEPWTTFGGDATRNRVLTQGLPWRLWEDGPAWHIKLPALAPNGKDKEPVLDRGSLSRRTAFHPVIVQNQVLLADHRSVRSYQLTTGKELFHLDLQAMGLDDVPAGIVAKDALPRFTLTVDHERAYVRLGRLGLGLKKEGEKEQSSYVVCLDLTQPEQKKARVLWHVKAGGDPKTPTMFEGAPLVHEGRVYIALSKIVDRRVSTSIVCYDALGRQRWTRVVCECPEFEENTQATRYRQHLLTWAGGQIAYCSHAGAIVAVDAWTGQPTWGVRYPSRGPLTPDAEPSPRDLTPCVYAEGRVFAAPLDSDRLFCIDAVTGQVRWELDGIEIVHLLGVAHGRVFVTTRNGVQAVRTATGQTDWMQPTEGRLPSLGRGLLAGGWLLWPTTDAKLPYRALTLRGGEQIKQDDSDSVLPEPPLYEPTLLSMLPVGNMAVGQGCLAIAGLDELVVFVPPVRQLPAPAVDFRPQARLETLYRKAKREAGAGKTTQAAQTYLELLEATRTHAQAANWRKLIEGRLQLLVVQAKEEKHGGASFTPFTDPRMPAKVRLLAWKYVIDTAQHQGKQDDALAACQHVLKDATMGQAWVPGPLPQQGAVWALKQQHKLLKAESGKTPSYVGAREDAVTLYHYLQMYPDASEARDALAQLAENARKEKQWSKAADAYRRLMVVLGKPVSKKGDLKARCLFGLARSLEGQGDYRSAWQSWTMLETQFGGMIEADSGQPYRTLLPSAKKEPYLQALLLSVPGGPNLPLVRAWEQADGRVWPIAADDYRDDFFFCTRPGQVTCRSSADGKLRWKQPLDFDPYWFGRWQDLVLIVGHDAVLALSVHDGRMAWSFPAASRMLSLGNVRKGMPLFSKEPAGFMHGQRWDDTLTLLEEERKFVQLRLDTGEVVWQHASPAASLRPLGVGFQTYFLRQGGQMLVQTEAGQPLWLGAKPLSALEPSRPWQQAPLIVDKCIVIAGERGRILAFDLSPPHSLRWTYKAAWPSSLTGELCRLFSKGSVLLALVPRNDGLEWICVEAARGKLLWSVRASQLPNGLDTGSVCLGEASYYYVCNGKLYARSLHDGVLQWQQPLLGRSERWQVRYTKWYLAVYPADAGKETEFTVGLIDPWDGRWLERLTFANGRGAGEVLLTPQCVQVSVAGKIFGFRSLGNE